MANRTNGLAKDYRPSDDEPFMNARQRTYFRKKLLAWREEILRESRETIQIRCGSHPGQPTAIGADGMRRMVVRHDEENIRRLRTDAG